MPISNELPQFATGIPLPERSLELVAQAMTVSNTVVFVSLALALAFLAYFGLKKKYLKASVFATSFVLGGLYLGGTIPTGYSGAVCAVLPPGYALNIEESFRKPLQSVLPEQYPHALYQEPRTFWDGSLEARVYSVDGVTPVAYVWKHTPTFFRNKLGKRLEMLTVSPKDTFICEQVLKKPVVPVKACPLSAEPKGLWAREGGLHTEG